MRFAALSIRTPEGIAFSQPLAGPVLRFFAWGVDAACIGAALLLLNTVLGIVGLFNKGLAPALGAIGYFVISIGYGILFEWLWRGQTLGKRVFGLRVVDAEGLRLQFDQVVTRNLLRAVDSLPILYFLGGVTCWFNRKCQRLGDIAGNTVVIRIPRIVEPDLDQLLGGRFNSLRSHTHLAVRLRQRTTPEEAAVALQALLRRDDFDPVARLQLFAEIASYFRQKVEFPPESSEGVADEQQIRNIVDIIYRTGSDAMLKRSGDPEPVK